SDPPNPEIYTLSLHDALPISEQNKYHWEALLFAKLAKNFGLKVNGEAFYQMAMSIPFHIVQKCQSNPIQLEALFLGQSGLLEKEDRKSTRLNSSHVSISYAVF